MHIIPFLTALSKLSLTDTAPESANPDELSPSVMQQSSMEIAFAIPMNLHLGFWEYALMRDGATLEDCCSWSNVQCTDGVVTTIVLDAGGGNNNTAFAVKLEFLPATLRFLHFQRSFVSSFSLRSLPRDLCYVFMDRVSVSGALGQEFTNSLSLRHLPLYAEEVFLRFQQPIFQTVALDDLPTGLRLLYIAHPSIKSAIVDNKSLPASLERANIFSSGFGRWTTLISVDGDRVDSRITSAHEESVGGLHRSDFRYFEKCEDICRDIRPQRQNTRLAEKSLM